MLFFDLFRHDPNLLDLPPGATLFRAGEAGDVMYVLVSGRAQVWFNGVTLEEVKPGDILGELAVIDTAPRTATVTALTDCTFAVIDQKRFQFLVEQTPNFAVEVMRVLARRLRQCDQRLTGAPVLDSSRLPDGNISATPL